MIEKPFILPINPLILNFRNTKVMFYTELSGMDSLQDYLLQLSECLWLKNSSFGLFYLFGQ